MTGPCPPASPSPAKRETGRPHGPAPGPLTQHGAHQAASLPGPRFRPRCCHGSAERTAGGAAVRCAPASPAAAAGLVPGAGAFRGRLQALGGSGKALKFLPCVQRWTFGSSDNPKGVPASQRAAPSARSFPRLPLLTFPSPRAFDAQQLRTARERKTPSSPLARPGATEAGGLARPGMVFRARDGEIWKGTRKRLPSFCVFRKKHARAGKAGDRERELPASQRPNGQSAGVGPRRAGKASPAEGGVSSLNTAFLSSSLPSSQHPFFLFVHVHFFFFALFLFFGFPSLPPITTEARKPKQTDQVKTTHFLAEGTGGGGNGIPLRKRDFIISLQKYRGRSQLFKAPGDNKDECGGGSGQECTERQKIKI